MQDTSRQVFKKRGGVSIPVSASKRRVFKPLLFFETELKKLDIVLDENDTDLEDLISLPEQEKLKDAYYLKFIKNQYNLTGRPQPFNITITVKFGKNDLVKILEDILNCFRLPLSIGIDFWAVLTSLARPEGDILYPSRATSCNKTKLIRTNTDIMSLLDEFKVLPTETIIQQHFVSESGSGMNLQNMLAAEIYISRYNFQ